MKKQTIFATALLTCTGFHVQAGDFQTIEDADGNGSYSFDEIKASNPDFDAAQMGDLDLDSSGELSEEELDAVKD